MTPAGVVLITSGARRACSASDQSATRTETSSRSAHCRISAARASLRTYTAISPGQIRARAASADEAVAPAPRTAAASTLSMPCSRKAATIPGMSVLSPVRRPSRVQTTVLTASTEAAVSLIPSSSGITARFSGMVSDSPAHSAPSVSKNPGRAASSTSSLSYVQPLSPNSR